jgi:hypothetical protein
MTTRYLSYGVVDGRNHSDRDLDQLRIAATARAERRRVRRAGRARLR